MIELYQGDCLEIMPRIPEKTVDMVLCDLPYGITSRNKWDVVIPFDEMWNQVNRVTKKTSAVCLFGQMPFGSDLIQSNRKNFRYEWIWHKTNPLGFLNANRMPLRTHENILVFYRALPKYNPQMWYGKPWKRGCSEHRVTKNYGKFDPLLNKQESPDGERYPIDVIKFSNANRTKQMHPTQKPVPLLEYFIKTYTDEGDTVLDFCMGSGSTGIACANLNRNFIGIEKDENYFKVAEQRIKGVANE